MSHSPVNEARYDWIRVKPFSKLKEKIPNFNDLGCPIPSRAIVKVAWMRCPHEARRHVGLAQVPIKSGPARSAGSVPAPGHLALPQPYGSAANPLFSRRPSGDQRGRPRHARLGQHRIVHLLRLADSFRLSIDRTMEDATEETGIESPPSANPLQTPVPRAASLPFFYPGQDAKPNSGLTLSLLSV